MKVVILNGNPLPQQFPVFESYLGKLSEQLTSGGHTSDTLTLRDMTIRYCTGCFGCWVKTPGECVARDESAQVCRAVIQSDLVIMASPLRMGFASALLKKTMDKLIPLVHPYIVVAQGEIHHRSRYAHYPLVALLLEPQANDTPEDVALNQEIFARTALNLKSRLAFTRLTQDDPQEVLDEINRL